jgi:hypothetical protein
MKHHQRGHIEADYEPWWPRVRAWMRRNLHPNWHGHLLVLAFVAWAVWKMFYGERP